LIQPPESGQGGSGDDTGDTQSKQGFFSDVLVLGHPVFGSHSCLLAVACARAQDWRGAFILGAFRGNVRALFRVISKISFRLTSVLVSS
jgi:hypothetical protein